MSGQLDLRGVLPMGTMLRSYELLSVLGHGGFGVTYLARDTTLDRRVAIKEYLPIALALRENDSTVVPRSTELAGEFSWGRERFLDEAKTLGKLSARAIVHVYDFLEANGTAYMVMALAAGETLDNRISRGPLPQPVIDRLLPPLLDGLEHVHEAGFLHRDIKPANILIDGERPTLIDFGASRAAIAGRTAAMTAIFTPGYAAAEQFSSAKQGPWTDIYGLSATLYHAITGRAPPSAIERILDDEYQPLTRLMPAGFSYALLAAIDAGMAVRAANRPQSIAGWRALMLEAKARAEPAATMVMPRADSRGPRREPEPQPEARAPQRPRSIVRRVIVVGVILLAAGGYFGKGIFRTTDKPQRTTDVAATAPEPASAAVPAPAIAAVATPAPVQAPTVDDTAAQARKQQEEAQATAARQAEEEAKKKIVDDAAAEKKAAEAAEASLKLATPDRHRLQVALTALGFDTRGVDGTFGPRSREMIAAWQKARNQPATGFFTAAQQQALLKDGAVAVQKHDDEQKKIEDDKKKTEEEAKKKAEEEKAKAAAATPAPSLTPAPPVAAGQMLEEKKFTLPNTAGAGCATANAAYAIRIYADKVELQSINWDTFALDGAGGFSGEFTNRLGNPFTVSGNVKTRAIVATNVRNGCTFAGKF